MINKEIRKDGTKTGIFLIIHQTVFQLGTMIMLFLTAMFLPSCFLGLFGISLTDSALMYIASDLMQLVAGIMFLVFYLVNRKKMNEVPMKKSSCTVKKFFKCLLIVLAVNMAVSAIDYILQLTLNVRLAGDSEPLDSSPIIMLFFIGVFPAVFEELIYRGVLYRYLRRHGEVFAAIVSSLIFGLVHMNFVQLVFAASMGFVLCRLYEATGKLRYGMLIHFLNNSIMVISYYLPVSETMNIMIQIVLGVIAIIGLSIFVFRKRKAACLETISSCKSFFVAVPMILLTVICLGFCVMMVNS